MNIKEELISMKNELAELKERIEADDAEAIERGMQLKADIEAKEKEVEAAETRAFENYIRGYAVSNERAANMTLTDNGAVIPKTIANKIIRQLSARRAVFLSALYGAWIDKPARIWYHGIRTRQGVIT